MLSLPFTELMKATLCKGNTVFLFLKCIFLFLSIFLSGYSFSIFNRLCTAQTQGMNYFRNSQIG